MRNTQRAKPKACKVFTLRSTVNFILHHKPFYGLDVMDYLTTTINRITAADLFIPGKKTAVFYCGRYSDYPSHRTAPSDNFNIATEDEAHDTITEVIDFHVGRCNLLQHQIVIAIHDGIDEDRADLICDDINARWLSGATMNESVEGNQWYEIAKRVSWKSTND